MEVAYLIIGAPAQAFDEEQHQAVEYGDDEEDGDELRELVLNDGDKVVFPGMLNGLEGVDRLILRGHGWKVHDYDVSLSGDAVTQNASAVCKMQLEQCSEIEVPPAGGDGG
jgi:hypothetical protein